MGFLRRSLKELVAYWQDRYDWRAAEAQLNQLPQFRAGVGDLGIHFVHQRGVGPKPFPLIITHGWPGSIFEFTKILGPLTDPGSHGGDPADAFDVVAPSMPGYGFSDHATRPGMDAERIAGLWAQLMRGLGYARFGAQGGDWGAMVSTYLGARHADAVVGIHLNLVIAFPPDPTNPLEGLSSDEVLDMVPVQKFLKEETGYQRIQGTRPQTLGYALNDSPAGLAAWIVDKPRLSAANIQKAGVDLLETLFGENRKLINTHFKGVSFKLFLDNLFKSLFSDLHSSSPRSSIE